MPTPHELFTHQSPLPGEGFAIQSGGPPATALADAVQGRLVGLGFLQNYAPLAELHHHLPPEAMALNEHYTNALGRAFYTPDDAILAAYHGLIAHLARAVFPWDFLFQVQPIVRFHFPVPFPESMRTRDGVARQIHSDILGGHPVRMIQAWIALTDCAGTAALQCSTRDAGIALLSRYRARLRAADPPFADSLRHFYDSWDAIPGFGEAVAAACNPVPMRAGDALFFDPRCLHGGTENREDITRVSVDFRLLPVEHEAAVLAQADTPTARRFRRGELFHAATARQFASA